MENKKTYEQNFLDSLKDPTPTEKIKIEGVGEVELFGSWNAEKIIKRLLESESITG
jgi:hypothetical protein